MKSVKALLTAVFLLSLIATSALATTARLQVIHNSADPAAAVVDVYVNDGLFIDEFEFRAATPFQDVPAGVTLEIGVAPGGASTPGDIIATFPVVLEEGKTYVAVANGFLNPDDFDKGANGDGIAFNIFAADNIRESARWSRLVDLRVFHGSTDAPAVDVRVQNWPWGPLVRDLSYGEFSWYRSLFAKEYVLDITPAGDRNTVVASFKADLSGLSGGAAVVFASGFLNPAANQGGAAFGLFVALPNGAVVALPAVDQTARVQVIHNAADPAAAAVDIYLDGSEIVPDFAFRAATPFVDLPAGREIVIGVAPGNSTGAGDIIAEFPVTLEAGETYVVFANGVLDPSQFAENPEGAEIAFSLYPRGGARESSYSKYLVKLIGFHGATDAPTVDIVVKGKRRSWNLINDLSYGEFSSYRWLFPRKYTLYVTPGNDNSTAVAAYDADLRGLGGGAAVVFASGFLSPGDNQNGAAFGLFAALPNGSVIALPAAVAMPTIALSEGLDNATQAGPAAFETTLGQNYPNPFNPSTTIKFSLDAPTTVTLGVYNAKGQLVERLVDGSELSEGVYDIPFNATGMASGVYFYRLEAGSYVEMKKMVLLK
jgi:hypothetical protein